MVKEKKVSISWIMPVVISMLCLVFLLVFILPDENYKVVSKNEKIEALRLTGYEGFGSLRAAIFYKKKSFVSGSSPLVKSICTDDALINYNINPKNLKNIFNDKPFRISDLSMPFVLSKEANSDTIIIKKDGCIFYFKMSRYDGPYK